jgi:hypothetical protein
MVERREPPHVGPDPLAAGVEDVWAVLVHADAQPLLGVAVSGDVRPPVDDEAPLARVRRLAGEHGPEEPGADDQVVVRTKRHATFSTDPTGPGHGERNDDDSSDRLISPMCRTFIIICSVV